MVFRKILLLSSLISAIFASNVISGNIDSAQTGEQEEQFLPIGLTAEEMLRLDEIGINHIGTSPPPGPVRNCAEWEPSVGVIIRWPLGISISLIAEMSEDLMVTTIVGSTSAMNSAISAYTSGGVNMDNTQFIIAATNSIWTRDYGPWFIFNGDNEMAIVDHIYNRPRPLDDQIPWIIGGEWGMDVYGMDVIHTGGNHMSDGLGVSMSTRLVYDENPSLTASEVDSIMLAFVGNDYTVLDYIEYSGIHHLDCWAKFLNPSTILVKDVPPGDYSHDLLDARAEYLSQQISSWGKPYTIIRIYCPSGTAYTNSIILNDKVFVPIFNDPYDDYTLSVYQEAMPGYEILGFTGSWYDDDAIHCRAMGVPDREMLYIEHVPLSGAGDTLKDYPVTVKITDYSEQGLVPESLKVFYSINARDFSSVYLNATSNPDSFYALIPAQPMGTQISYYIQAADSSGRVETHPYIGAPWAHRFYVNMPPEIVSADSIICQTSDEFGYYPEFIDVDDSTHQITYTDYPVWLDERNDSLVGTAPDSPESAGFTVKVADEFNYDEQEVYIMVYLCGDPNGDGNINLLDVTFLINYLYKEGADPSPLESADVNNTANINILDISYLINYIYKEGSPPDCP